MLGDTPDQHSYDNSTIYGTVSTHTYTHTTSHTSPLHRKWKTFKKFPQTFNLIIKLLLTIFYMLQKNMCDRYIDTRIWGPTAPMHLGLKERALCAPLSVSPPSSPEALHVRQHERPLSAKDGIMGEKWLIKFSLQWDFHGNCMGILHAAKLWHGTDGFTSPLKEGMLRVFSLNGLGQVWTRELGYQRPAC
jgi:hypothetical protein